MGPRPKLITAADIEKMTPQQRADAVESARSVYDAE